MAIKEQIKSIIRRATRGDILNILVMGATHERYEETLCKTGHNFFSIKIGKEWDKSYAKIPHNYHILEEIPYDLDIDLILCHTSDQRLDIGMDLSERFDVPLIRHTHTLPQCQKELEAHQSKQVTLNTFISDYSMEMWGYKNLGLAIDHGMDISFWKKDMPRENICLSVVNYWKDRDWACGWDLWNKINPGLPVKVLGTNPGLSRPADSIEHLRDCYNSSLIFLNTSLNSPIPMSLLEAMASGCAVVTTPNPMINKVVKHGKTGFIFKNSEEARTYCKDLLNNPKLAQEIGKSGQELVANLYNIDRFTTNWNKTFKKVLYK